MVNFQRSATLGLPKLIAVLACANRFPDAFWCGLLANTALAWPIALFLADLAISFPVVSTKPRPSALQEGISTGAEFTIYAPIDRFLTPS